VKRELKSTKNQGAWSAEKYGRTIQWMSIPDSVAGTPKL